MHKKRSYTGFVSLIYAAAAVLTCAAFILPGFAESRGRFITSLLSVLAAESAVYGYSLFWLRSAGKNRHTPPVLISGAWVTAAYAAAVCIAAAMLDWGLQLPPRLYMTVQLVIMLISVALLGSVVLYGHRAAAGERRTADAVRAHRQHQAELRDIRELAGGWRHPGAEWLAELIGGLEEQFRYSDPLSRPELYDTEEMLTRQISLLHDQVALLLALQDPGSGWEGTAAELAGSITGTLQRRNRELAALK
ncbi:hypothetical protein [Paenibacillus sp. FSL R7-0331]|uniref:hypothetical protein n=1 Tax=Paenibacillus sp. FSL R7-0331 TaxID=1536773 RepID=UPI0004F7474D|nr:hypothetical protein [Paenibacillus sp. FSL R7-0331]AIQ54384.1 hypothetical protein R70331_24585 [Paenibacillus sp. FSL R7-0331]